MTQIIYRNGKKEMTAIEAVQIALDWYKRPTTKNEFYAKINGKVARCRKK